MTGKETLQVMAIIRQFYPQYYRDTNREEAQRSAVMWQDMFANDDGSMVYAAVKAFISSDTKGFPPSVGQIREKLVKIQNPDALSENEAWAMVSKAIRNSSYHAREEFEKLPPLIQRVVGNPSVLKEWAMTQADDLQTVVASNFMRSYRTRLKSNMEYLAMPEDIRAMLDKTTRTMQLPEAPNPDEQKRQAILLLAEDRERMQRDILGEEYDKPDFTREETDVYAPESL